MAEPFLAEIRMVGFNFAPRGFALCDGQILPINQNQSLFTLLGTTYGGDGETSFALPDLRGRTPLHFGSGFTQGSRAGQDQIELTVAQIPPHSHLRGTGDRGTSNRPPVGALASRLRRAPLTYATPGSFVRNGALPAGAGRSHVNMQPYLVINFCIALQGLFPSRN